MPQPKVRVRVRPVSAERLSLDAGFAKLKNSIRNPTAWPKSRWNFWEEGVSSSLLNLWLTCREQFRLEVVEGWRSHNTPFYFAFGTCSHWCLQQAYAKPEIPNAKGVAKLVGDFERLWKKERPQAPQKQRESQEKVYGLAEALLPTYFQRWAGDFPGEKYPRRHNTVQPKTWEGLEKRFEYTYTYPDGKKVPIRGTRDGLIYDAKRKLWLFDSKFRSVINEEDTLDTLPHDFQQMLYLLVTMEEYKQAPAGTVMNIARRPGHRQGQNEGLREFLKRVAKDVANPKRWDHYFMRVQMDITPREIQEWRTTQLDPLMLDVRAWWEGRAPHYMNPNALISKYGRCQMFNAIVFKNYNGLYRRPAGSIMNYQTDLA